MFVLEFSCIALYCLGYVSSQGGGGGMLKQDEDGMSGTIQFGGPQDLNDEMMQSPFVPDQLDLKCDACKAIAHQVS